MRRTMTQEEATSLEALVDAYGLAQIVGRLATIAWEKSEHIATNWQDAGTAQTWSRAAAVLDKAEQATPVQAVS